MPANAEDIRIVGETLAGAEEDLKAVLKRIAGRHQALFGAYATERYMQDSGFSVGSTVRDPSDQGPLRIDTGDLARAVRGDLQARGTFTRSVMIVASGIAWRQKITLPYAAIHEYGGRVPATEQMEAYFWAKMYEAGPDTDTGQRWKALALGARANSHFAIPARPYAEPGNEDARDDTADFAATELTDLIQTLSEAS